MKAYTLIFCFIFILLSGTTNGETRNIIISSNPAYPPYHYCDEAEGDAVLYGASMMLLDKIKPQNVKIIYNYYPWKRVLREAELGNIQLVTPLRKNTERENYLKFTNYPAFENPIVVFYRKDKPINFNKMEDLKQYKGGVSLSLGDVFGGGVDEYINRNLRVETAANMDRNFNKLLKGRIDYFITGLYVGRHAINNSAEFKAALTWSGNYVNNDFTYFSFSKNDHLDDMISYFDSNLKKLWDIDRNAGFLEDALTESSSRQNNAGCK